MFARTLVQAVQIRRASLLICISEVFRDHLVHDYHFPRERTTVIANPLRLERFDSSSRAPARPPLVLVPGRLSMRKGLEDVVAVARLLLARGVDARLRVIGGPSMWSDYSGLLEELPRENSEYGGRTPPMEMSSEFARSDLVLVASKYEPFGLTAAEALASGVPVVATSEVGAIEDVDAAVAASVAPGDVEAITMAIAQMLDRLRAAPEQLRALARAEAERRFAREVVCEQLSLALERLRAAPR
jgi:mannosylfructose-phosphate synthase